MTASTKTDDAGAFQPLPFSLYEARTALGIPQRAMARHLDITLKTWNNYETGRHRVPVFIHMAVALMLLTRDNLDREAVRKRISEIIKRC